MAESSSSASSPALTASSPPSSVPSPQMQNLTLTDLVPVSDEDKAAAARIKAEANKAFTSTFIICTLPSVLLRAFAILIVLELISCFV
jgi:hypothetical protein